VCHTRKFGVSASRNVFARAAAAEQPGELATPVMLPIPDLSGYGSRRCVAARAWLLAVGGQQQKQQQQQQQQQLLHAGVAAAVSCGCGSGGSWVLAWAREVCWFLSHIELRRCAPRRRQHGMLLFLTNKGEMTAVSSAGQHLWQEYLQASRTLRGPAACAP
jgi:hypothetical protein